MGGIRLSFLATLRVVDRGSLFVQNVYAFLYKPRRWWLPLRVVGWTYAYAIVAFAVLVCVLLTLGIILKILGI